MKWSRDDDETVDERIVLRFPNGFQVTLDLTPPPSEEFEDDETQLQRPEARDQWQTQREHERPPGLDNSRARILLAWNMIGLSLFAGRRVPTLHEVAKEAERVLLVLMMERHSGNLTHVASELGASRRTVRERLKAGGLYDWSRFEDEKTEQDEGVEDTDREHEDEDLDPEAEGGEPDREDEGDEADREDEPDDPERDREEPESVAENEPRFELEEAHADAGR